MRSWNATSFTHLFHQSIKISAKFHPTPIAKDAMLDASDTLPPVVFLEKIPHGRNHHNVQNCYFGSEATICQRSHNMFHDNHARPNHTLPIQTLESLLSQIISEVNVASSDSVKQSATNGIVKRKDAKPNFWDQERMHRKMRAWRLWTRPFKHMRKVSQCFLLIVSDFMDIDKVNILWQTELHIWLDDNILRNVELASQFEKAVYQS